MGELFMVVTIPSLLSLHAAPLWLRGLSLVPPLPLRDTRVLSGHPTSASVLELGSSARRSSFCHHKSRLLHAAPESLATHTPVLSEHPTHFSEEPRLYRARGRRRCRRHSRGV
ncbi:hypothetical protein DFH08DRAFT_496250 [Mycena albidolilacea]|uniref:Secreted protein n=1 Tax=Mycena albidolilacea TaxID=1033008 RepID=A0AAD7ACK0_9AGAR|nr:hypothetical protein DFH08DRAFT_496250 [Mycena albidolilacea]